MDCFIWLRSISQTGRGQGKNKEVPMKLPNAEIGVVEQEKIIGYLLNPMHRHGASKARFFKEFGFRVEAWEKFAEALREHARQHNVVRTKETGFGPRYEVEGDLSAPDGRSPRVRTVWQMDEGQIAPRLITAYPMEAL
jgi:hypothetical protein